MFLFRLAYRFLKLLGRGFGTMFVLGLSLLPLSVLLLAVPAFLSQESVLEDTTAEASWLRRTLKRCFAFVTGLVVLLTLIAASVEVVTRLPLPETGSFAVISKFFMPAPGKLLVPAPTDTIRNEMIDKIPDAGVRYFMRTPVHDRLPPAMVEHWPFVVLGVYAFDLLILVFIGKVPLAYNLRNVRVRWKTNAMTAFAFTAVIGLLVFLLAFVNGMNNMTENSGVAGNVLVLSDGSTDEVFSNLGYGDIDNVERVVAELDEKDRRLKAPVRVRRIERDGKPVALASKETYYSINQRIPNSSPPRSRFVQLRSIEDADVAAKVHDIELYPGGRWFRNAGVNDQSQIECVLGEVEWVVTGVMKSEGKTFGSEVWVKRFSRIYQPFGKDKYTTLVLRTEQDTREAARAMAHHLTRRYTQQKLKAFAEPDYYAELTKTNNFFLTAVVVVAVVMAIGGVFGMMTTMFASIAQRIRDIGVLRLLGFKRWQVMVSFMLESLTIAALGGALGVLVAWLLADGRASTSTLSSGGGGPGGKSIALTINVDAQVMAMGMLFTLVMGRLGGLVPALSAMRLKILDSLR